MVPETRVFQAADGEHRFYARKLEL